MSTGRTVALLGIVLLLFGDFLRTTPDPFWAIFSPSGVVVLLGLLLGFAGVWLALVEEAPADESR